MLTGTYLVQKDKHRFSNGRVDPICPLCGVGDEDIEHSKEVQTRCVEPTFRSLVFIFLNDVLS
jgi:hypothetical protein